jgi:hypothetical protein
VPAAPCIERKAGSNQTARDQNTLEAAARHAITIRSVTR